MSHNSSTSLSRNLIIDLAYVTEQAAIAAVGMCGKGDEKAADQVAVDAMRNALNQLDIDGTIVIGEGERDEAPMLYIGEKVGTTKGIAVDIALDPLEGTTICAKDMPNSLAVVAVAKKGNLLYAPDVYMEKIAIGAGYPKNIVSLNNSPTENILALAKAKGVAPAQIMACVMDRPRHENIINEIRATGAGVRLIGDGDVAAVIHTATAESTIDIYMGIGGAPEGVLAAAALRCLGGQMEARLILDTDEKIARAAQMGIKDPNKIYQADELAKGDDVIFSATGVTDGNMLSGVKICDNYIKTHTLVMRSATKTIQFIETKYPNNK
ncbi:class II fructose-bisphosphatase [Bartonella sp. DGB1]|uniref:class II fructose-bisphosphatase n=1 Tax=Bartonella sp. DGB1 TaxID=3239807 RepID=UPI003525CD3A